LVKTLIKKTRYHADKLARKFKGYFGPYKNLGEYRLSVLDPAQPIFSKLTAIEKTTPGKQRSGEEMPLIRETEHGDARRHHLHVCSSVLVQRTSWQAWK